MINIIGLGNCGNNILNTISKFRNKNMNLISLQKDLQIFLFSKSDINIEIKSGFTKQLDEILKNSSKIFIICSSAGTISNEYLPFLIDSLNSFQIEYKIILITPFSFENKGIKSDSLISKVENKENLIIDSVIIYGKNPYLYSDDNESEKDEKIVYDYSKIKM